MQLSLLNRVHLADFTDFIHYSDKFISFGLIIDQVSFSSSVGFPPQILLVLRFLHVDVIAVKVILTHLGVVVELSPLIMLLGTLLFLARFSGFLTRGSDTVLFQVRCILLSIVFYDCV